MQISRRLLCLAVWPLVALLAPSNRPIRSQSAFADPAFQRVWERTDRLVAAGIPGLSWYWGPAPGRSLFEPDANAPGGQRRVQYFDKARMEINNPGADPNSPFFVTNGLLSVELMTGQLQLGDTQFAAHCPAAIPLASDTDDASAPTYATFGQLLAQPKRNQVGGKAITVVDRAGNLHADPAKSGVPGVGLVYYEPATGRTIPQVFWTFLNASGPIYQAGQPTTGKINDPWFYASGLPMTEAYWARVKVAGTLRDVLIQAFERRVLTYIPDYNGSPFSVQMGNVGQHYYDWRYSGAGCAPPTPPTPLAIPRYAIDPTGEFAPANLAAARAAGGQLVRVYTSWGGIDPGTGDAPAYNWGAYDDTFARVAAAGLQPIALIDGCPAWACTHDTGPVDKVSAQRFGQFLIAAAAHYSRAPYNVHFWEIFNEPDTTSGPDHQIGFGLHGDQYAALLRAAVPGMRAADPQAQVLIGGMAYEWFMDENPNPGPFNRNWLRDVVAAGGAAYFDYLNFHYYPQNPHWPSIADKAAALDRLQAGLGIHKPLVSTESGLTSSPDARWRPPGWPAGSEEVQSRYVARLYAEGLGAGLRSITWFRLLDGASAPPGGEIFRLTGLIHVDGSPKPSAVAYRTVVREIGDRPFLRSLDAAALGAAGAQGYAFGAGGQQVWVVWSRSEAVVPVRPASGTIDRAYDMLGAAQGLSGASVAAGPDPVYLEINP